MYMNNIIKYAHYVKPQDGRSINGNFKDNSMQIELFTTKSNGKKDNYPFKFSN